MGTTPSEFLLQARLELTRRFDVLDDAISFNFFDKHSWLLDFHMRALSKRNLDLHNFPGIFFIYFSCIGFIGSSISQKRWNGRGLGLARIACSRSRLGWLRTQSVAHVVYFRRISVLRALPPFDDAGRGSVLAIDNKRTCVKFPHKTIASKCIR
jgi:hypothetical protein